MIPVSALSSVGELAADGPHDAVLLVGTDLAQVAHEPLRRVVSAAAAVDASSLHQTTLQPAPDLAGGRLVIAPTGPLGRDHDDVRRFADAAASAMRRARAAGARRPALVVHGIPDGDARYVHALEVAVLGAAGAVWEPLEARESLGADVEQIESLGVLPPPGSIPSDALRRAHAIEAGRRVARDLGGTEPERMAPPRFADYCVEHLGGLERVKCTVLADPDELLAGYPLLMAVARASMPVERHRPRVVRLEYLGDGPTTRTLMLAGKGLTYDTGGADIKAGGAMAGMSRDKGGGAAVAGLFRTLAELAPAGVRVVAEIGAVRNSIGAESFVSDEIIKSHAGCRVRIGNTDAEGRLVLADLLSHLREDALRAPNTEAPSLMSVATLTGHSYRAAGPYSIALDNGPARAAHVADTLGALGDLWGDPFEISRLRREDWDFVRPRSRADDVLSCNNAPSTATARGHQFPMAFLALASGLDQHGADAPHPLPYTHLDIGGSATEGGDWQHGRPTGAPIPTLIASLLGR
jgi:leucyl aminopeptidase